MLSRLRLPLPVDAAALQRDADALAPDCWIAHFNRAGYTGEWSGAPLRSIGGALDRISLSPGDGEQFADTPLMAHCPAVAPVLASLSCELLAVRFLRLGSQASVLEHRDGGLGFEQGDMRIHVPVTTNPGVEFRHAGQLVEMRPGEAWYLNLDLPHSVENRGDSDRVHLLIDCRRNKWLEQLFRALAEEELTRTRAARGGATVWLTGQHGAGRTTLAAELAARLERLRQTVTVIDDDVASDALDAGVSHLGAAVAAALAATQHGDIAVVGHACAAAEERRSIRARHEEAGLRFLEVFVDCQPEVCDVRVRLRAGGHPPQAAGTIDAFEPPPAADVNLRSDRQTVGEEAEIVLTGLTQPVGSASLRWSL